VLKLLCHKLSSNLEYIIIYPISDLHVGDKSLDKECFRDFVKKIADDEHAYCVLVGDILNNAIVGSVSNSYNEEMPPKEQLKWARTELMPIKHKILGIVSGNHEYRSKKNTDTHLTEDLAEYLGIVNLFSEDELALKITFGKNGVSANPQMYTLYMTHGAGGGKKPGSGLNNAESLAMSVENADVYIVGHGHKRIAYKNAPRRIDAIHEKIQQIEKLFVMSSHWSSYFSGYAVRKMLTPSAGGSVPIKLYAYKKHAEATI